MTPRPLLPLLTLIAPLSLACAQAAPQQPAPDAAGSLQNPPPGQTVPPPAGATRTPDVIYVPTPQPVVEAMLKLAKVKKGDVLYDLGSGDGRIPVTAARLYGVRATGIDIDPARIAEAKANVAQAGVGNLVTIRQEDLFQTDFKDATVVTLYLLQSLNEKLRPKLLAELKPGTRIVSHAFNMGEWRPDATQEIDGNVIYLWTVPKRQR